MKLEYNITETVQEKDLKFINKEGEPFTADAIRTDYVPTNFEGTPKNYVLRKNHERWDTLHSEFVKKIHKEWLKELGYDTDAYYVHATSKEIIKNFDYDTLIKTGIEVTTPEEI
tara:strand:+ start:435 stop:776 length:342 start_codon:yes stop_codon:yes gene_type:complete